MPPKEISPKLASELNKLQFRASYAAERFERENESHYQKLAQDIKREITGLVKGLNETNLFPQIEVVYTRVIPQQTHVDLVLYGRRNKNDTQTELVENSGRVSIGPGVRLPNSVPVMEATNYETVRYGIRVLSVLSGFISNIAPKKTPQPVFRSHEFDEFYDG